MGIRDLRPPRPETDRSEVSIFLSWSGPVRNFKFLIVLVGVGPGFLKFSGPGPVLDF